MNKNWTIIGISGCTNSGKTTLSSFLQSYFPGSVIIKQDDYFRPDSSKEHILIPELNHKNWECLAAVNWIALIERLTQVLKTEPTSEKALIIVEGHIIFNYSPLEKLFHKKYFLTLNKEECFRRRITRVYDPPDIPGYFEKVVWPMYLSNKEEITINCRNIIYLDGTDNSQIISKSVLEDLKNYFST